MNLSRLMQVAMEEGMAVAQADPDFLPFALSSPLFDDSVHRIEFEAPTKQLARMELIIRLAQSGDHSCVLVMSTWITPSQPVNPEHVAWIERVRRGRARISDMPAAFREEVLYLVGEDATGALADRSWKILREANGVRFELMVNNETHMTTPWRPMFVR